MLLASVSRDLRARGPRPGPAAAQRDRPRHARVTAKEAQLDGVLRRRHRPRQDRRRACSTDNEDNIVRAAAARQAAAAAARHLLAGVPCLLKGAAVRRPAQRRSSKGNRVRQTHDASTPPSAGRTTAGDTPGYGEHGPRPGCFGLPNPKVPLRRHRSTSSNGTDVRVDVRGQPAMSDRSRNTADHRRRDQARHLRRSSALIVTGTLTAIMGSLRLRQRDRVQGGVHHRQPDPEGRRRPGRRRHGRLGQGGRDQGPRRRPRSPSRSSTTSR